MRAAVWCICVLGSIVVAVLLGIGVVRETTGEPVVVTRDRWFTEVSYVPLAYIIVQTPTRTPPTPTPIPEPTLTPRPTATADWQTSNRMDRGNWPAWSWPSIGGE